MAFPLVCAGAVGTTGAPLAGAASAEAVAPHTRQNLSSVSILLPQRTQNVLIHPSRRAKAAAHQNLHETYSSQPPQSMRYIGSLAFVPGTSVWYVAGDGTEPSGLKSCPDCAA